MEDGLSDAWAPKAAVYGLGQLAIGIAVLRRLERQEPEDAASGPTLQAWLARLARIVAALLLAALALRLLAQTASAFGPHDAWVPGNLRAIALESRWGHGWRWQVLAALAMLGASLLIPSRRAGWMIFDAGAIGLAVAIPLLGHAAGSLQRYGMHALHNLGAAVWVGALGALVLTAWRPGTPLRGAVPGLVRRFSPVALSAAAVALASGAIAGLVYAGSWASLWTTPHGRLLTVKLTGVAVVIACGSMNWRCVRRGTPPPRLVLTLEWLAALVVLGLTGALTETEHP
ncbi:MAG TPA: CopD family protein [Vicinamibacterales bacterium]